MTKIAVICFAVLTVAAQADECAPPAEDGGGGKPKKARVGKNLSLTGTSYKVTDVSTASSVGDNEFNTTKANGQFIVVKLTLTNEKDEPATILEDNIRLIGGNGKNYSTSDDAILAFGDQSLLLEEIQPDNSEKGTLVYDVPEKAVSGAKLQVKDLFSDATGEVRLGL